jgi:hypothetical protein
VAPLDPLLGLSRCYAPNFGWPEAQRLDTRTKDFARGGGSRLHNRIGYAEFAEARKGTISPGKLADLVILNRDLYKSDPGQLDRNRVLVTIVGGNGCV